MKNILVMLMALAIISCTSDKKEASSNDKQDSNKTEQTTASEDNSTSITTPAVNADEIEQLNIPPDENGVVHHYVCVDRCEGGFASDHGNCPVCGKVMGHNAGFHPDPGVTNPPDGNNNITVTPGADGSQELSIDDLPDGLKQQFQQNNAGAGNPSVNVGGPQAQEPPQNANGVWHFTCPTGCPGGAGQAGLCPVCGSTYEHNTAYHN